MSNQAEQREMKPAVKGSALSSSPVGKIIVVDDEPELRNILVETLSAQGFEVTGCSSGQQALDELRQKEFDLLLTDLMMPEMDGVALLEVALKVDPHLIGIMMTGQGTIQTAVDAMKLGAFDYVLKPFRLQTALPVLTRAMKTRHLRLENLQLRETVAIYELGQTIASTLDPQTVISELADAALQQTDADEVSVLLPTSEGSNELYVAAVRGDNRERLLGARVPLEGSISGWVAREREPLILEGEINDQRFRSLWPHPEIRSSVSIPMQVANKLVGTININTLSRPRSFTLGQMKALTIVASTAAAALENASLYSQVQKAEEKYRSIFENAVEGIFQSTPNRRFLAVNPALANILGYDSPKEVVACFTDIGKQLYVDPACPEHVTQTLKECGILQGFEFEAYRKGGEKIWLSLDTRVVHDEKGAEVCHEGTIEDITERKRAEAERLVMFEIIQGVSTSADLEALLKLIHQTIQKVVYAENCFVALYDEHTDTLDMQFFVDKYDSAPAPQKLGKSCAAHVFRTGESLLINQKLFDQLAEAGEVELVGEPSPSWLGVPLNTPAKTIGVLVVQHYEDDRAYSERDVEFLSSVGGQIAAAIERKLAEQALRESEERYRELVENAQDIIYSHDLKGNYTSSNKAGEEITGYTREESLKLNFRETIAPEYLEKVRQMLERKLAGEGTTAYELELIAKDGHRVPIEVNTRLVLEDGVPVGVTGIARDVTERKAAESELRRLAAAVEQTADSIVITDLKGNIKYVNPAFERVTGYAREEVLDQNTRILKSGKTDPAVYKELWETITRGDVWLGRLTNRRKDGTLFQEQVTISPIYDESHEILNYICVKQDISDLTLLEEQLRQSQKLEAIGQLAGGVAHDFNNLLTVIGGYSSILLEKLPQDSPHLSSIREIKKASDRASALTRQLLAFSRKQILQPKVLDLNVVVTDLEKMVRRLIGEDIDLQTITSPVLGKVRADPGQIEQVLLNLIVNARDAMPKGGKLKIETSNVMLSEEYARRHATQAGSYVMLAVTDTGCGMDATIQPRVFEPFFTTKGSGKGTGLGLATVYGIVKQSDGNIWVYSEVDRGTTFKVYLPRVDEVTEGEAEVSSKSIPQGTEIVLLVEDEDQVRVILKQILEEQGYHVLSASNGEEALLISQDLDRDIKLMITDVVMPQMSGRELAERVLQVRPSLPVLFMSGYTDDAIVRHGLLDEKLNFIQKPFDSATVARKVREVLDSHA